MDNKIEQITLKLPSDWKVALKIAAARAGRTLNAEVIGRLSEGVKADLQREASAQK